MQRIRIASIVAMVLCLAQPASVRAQFSNAGSMSMPGGSMAGTGSARTIDPGIAVTDSFLGFLDSAVPRSTTGARFDGNFNNAQSMRAEYLYPKGSFLGGRGFALPEARLNSYDLTSFAEYSWTPWFSIFVEGGYRWLDGETNGHNNGTTDMRYGLKLCTWSSGTTIATVLLRLYQPSAKDTLGTGHWAIEPGVLGAYRFNNMIQLEGEFRYWTPLGGSDFEGNIFRYGIGLSYGQRRSGFWIVPVVEAVGWSVLGGQTVVTNSANSFEIRDAQNTFILNGYTGVRVGWGQKIDAYVGYGRAFTTDAWQRDMFRVEFRYIY